MALIDSEAPLSSCTAIAIRRRSDVLLLDLLINFLPGITRVGARDCEGAIGRERCMHANPLAVMTIGGPLSEFDAISTHRIVLTVAPKAAMLLRGWIQAFKKKRKKNWGAHVVISKRIRESFVFLNDTICRDDPIVF
jgi:hypothetical protein